jgi:hypothetical protein
MDSTGSNIQAVLDIVRQTLDEAAVGAKFPDSDMVSRYMPMAIHAVLGRLLNDLDAPIFMRHDIEVSSGTTFYSLPAAIQEVHGLVKFDSAGRVLEEVLPTSFNHHDIRNRTWSIEGGDLRIEPHSISSGTWSLLYIPQPDSAPHYSTGGTLVDTSTLTLDSSPDLGLVDRRVGGYVGSTVRVIGSGVAPVEERTIATHTWTGSAWQVTFRKPLTVNTTPGTVTYEIVPGFDPALLWAVSHCMSLQIATSRREAGTFYNMLTRQYTEALKAVSDRVSNLQARTGKSFYVFDWLSK